MKLKILFKNPLAHDDMAWRGMAVPVEIAFASVLEDMQLRLKQSLFVITDNVEEIGDCHLGPFNPRAFVKWMREEELANIKTSGPIESSATNREIQGWFIMPYHAPCRDVIRDASIWIHKEICRANQEGKLKERAERKLKLESDAVAKYAENFINSWG